MADIADTGNEEAERFLAQSLAAANAHAPAPFTGYCLNCHEVLGEPLRWCDDDCRDDWQHRNPSGYTPHPK